MMLPILALGVAAVAAYELASKAPAWRILTAPEAWAAAKKAGNPPAEPSPLSPGIACVLVLENTTTGQIAALLCGYTGKNADGSKYTLQIAATDQATAPAGYEVGHMIDVDPSEVVWTH